MKTDKLFYRIFLNQPSLIRELLPEIPEDCQFEYQAPVLKEKEIRLDGLLTPIGDNPNLPLIFLEAQKILETVENYFDHANCIGWTRLGSEKWISSCRRINK